MKKIARLISIADHSDNFRWAVIQHHYLMSPPLEGNTYVIVSAANLPDEFGGPETYIFPGDSKGMIVEHDELEGSLKGTLVHANALKAAGYVVDRPKKLGKML